MGSKVYLYSLDTFKYEACYQMMREYLPDSYMIITSALPLPGRTEFLESIRRINDKMDEWAETEEMVEIAHTFDLAYEYAQNYPTGWDGWTHLNQDGLKSVLIC